MGHILSISIDVAMNCDLHVASEGESHNSPRYYFAPGLRGSEAGGWLSKEAVYSVQWPALP